MPEKKHGTYFTKPCAADASKLRLDYSPKRKKIPLRSEYYDPRLLPKILKESGLFTKMQPSPSLGLVKLRADGVPVTVFFDGKVSVKECRDKDEALEVLDLFLAVSRPAVLCEECGLNRYACKCRNYHEPVRL